jgi:amidase
LSRAAACDNEARPYQNMSSWISFASLAGLPATAAPIGRTNAGLPIGRQILAPMWEDGTSIEFAALLGETLGAFIPPTAFRD